MEIGDETWTVIGTLAAACATAGAWLYARISGLHGRIDTVTNHMTAEDNKLHDRIDTVRDQYVRREDLDARMQRIEKVQDETLKEVKELGLSIRHKTNNTDQVVSRMDERVKHLEERR